MPYDKGDFTQQGINGDVSALVRLNEKRVMKVVLSSDDESDNCDISGAVYDLLNGTSYPLGGTEPTGTITITENGTGIDVAQYALADVNVSSGGELGTLLLQSTLGTITNSSTTAVDTTYNIVIPNGANYDLIILIFQSNATDDTYNRATVQSFWNYEPTGPVHPANTFGANNRLLNFINNVNGYCSSASTANTVGVYLDNKSFSGTDITGDVFSKFNSNTTTGIIDATYSVTVYGIDLLTMVD